MDVTDIREIRAMWHEGKICCDRYAARYVSQDKDIYGVESMPFLSLNETEQKRHLQYIKKMLTGDIGGKIVSAGFEGKVPEMLTANREKRLCDAEAFGELCAFIRNHYEQANGYVIMAYHALYDIPALGTDKAVQEDNDEIYEYLLCMICPTKFTKVSLAVKDGRVTTTVPERVICAPATGFIWPAFTDRHPDPSSVIICNADTEDPEHTLYRNMDIQDFRTTEEIRRILGDIFADTLKNVVAEEEYLTALTVNLGKLAPETAVTAADFNMFLKEIGLEDLHRADMAAAFRRRLEGFCPAAYQLMTRENILSAVKDRKGERMRNLLLRAAGAIEDISGTESELVRELRTAADMTGGGE